ncbi:MAG: lytic transglycosylase domain-containing protein [Granulosicoccus sp.]|nr:lytic transglycosylase domain-containing protein [Granulosicoccus sp.]
MITWRAVDQQSESREPIAHVRCMGLTPQAVARRADRYDRLILDIAVEHDVSVSLIKAIITEESCFNNTALSPVGAQGLMQLMPATARWLNVNDPLDPADNLRAGVRYIASLQEQFESLELALAAYNAGPGNVRRYKGVPPFAETQAYVQKVKAHYRRYVAATSLAAR